MRLRVITAVLMFAGLGLAARADVTNPNFSPAISYPGYGAVPGWNASGSTGSNDSTEPFWDNGTLPASTVGFIQGDGDFNQTLTLVPGTTYTLSFYDNAREGMGCNPACNATPSLTVLLNGGTLIASTPVSPVGDSNTFDFVTDTFVATSASELLEFMSMTGVPGAAPDGTLLLSDVHVIPTTPEPSSLMLLGTGILGAAGMMRRRFLRS